MTMDPSELERLDRERRDADRRYNEALTALDRDLVSTIAGLAAHKDDAARVASALLVFLQQITPFVDSKDRHQAGLAGADVEQLRPVVDAISELRTQVAVLNRQMQALSSRTSGPPPRTNPSPANLNIAPDDEYKYLAFEDQFRGTDEAIGERLRRYVPIFAGASDVVDLGCGRGEFLAALKAAGIPARGVDLNAEMVAAARARGLHVERSDALSYLNTIADGSIGGLIATQVVEHLEPAYLLRLLDAAARALRPGSAIVLETINAACWLAFFSSYIRDVTHVRPIHPETLQYLLRASGFERVTIEYSAAVPDHMKMTLANLPAETIGGSDAQSRAFEALSHALNANATILNNLMFTHLDFAAIGYRS
jgi:SAM-dependent methyltransferase